MDTIKIPAHDQARQPSLLIPGGVHAPGRVIAVGSGKGGVGKTSLVANICVAFAKLGHSVLAVDGDLGMANLDIALGVTPDYSMLELMSGDVSIDEVLAEAHGVFVLPGCSGNYQVANMMDLERQQLFSAIDALEDRFDTLVIDTSAGIGSNAVHFAAAAQEVIVVANTEPTSLADAYGLIKVLSIRCGVTRVSLVANMVRSVAEGEEVLRRLHALTDRFLSVRLDYLGAVLRDEAMAQAICEGVPILVNRPNSVASKCIMSIVKKIASRTLEPELGGIRLFWKRLLESTPA